jgi:RimJ/RimL family protein N-acetyltransferase
MVPCPHEIRTERLLLRRWREEDVGAYRRLNADPEVMRYFLHPFSIEESDASAQRIRGQFDTTGTSLWALEIPGEAPFIGIAGCFGARPEMPYAPAIEIGWRLDKAFWGRGFAPEAALASLRDTFSRLAPEEVVACTTPSNAPSRRVMEKIGMIHDAANDFDHPNVPDGHPMRRSVLYRVKRDVFRAMAA